MLITELNAAHHGEHGLLVMVVHLNLGDIRPETGDVVNDGIGQPTVVGTDGGDNDLHVVVAVRTIIQRVLNYRSRFETPLARPEIEDWLTTEARRTPRESLKDIHRLHR
jgi:hypothetical protein